MNDSTKNKAPSDPAGSKRRGPESLETILWKRAKMTVTEKAILARLIYNGDWDAPNRGNGFISGQTLAHQLGTSRSNIYTHLNSMRDRGWVDWIPGEGKEQTSNKYYFHPNKWPRLKQPHPLRRQVERKQRQEDALIKKLLRSGLGTMITPHPTLDPEKNAEQQAEQDRTRRAMLITITKARATRLAVLLKALYAELAEETYPKARETLAEQIAEAEREATIAFKKYEHSQAANPQEALQGLNEAAHSQPSPANQGL